jgi:hypothetical protein
MTGQLFQVHLNTGLENGSSFLGLFFVGNFAVYGLMKAGRQVSKILQFLERNVCAYRNRLD